MTTHPTDTETKEGLKRTLRDLLALHGAPGFEQSVVKYVKSRLEPLAECSSSGRNADVSGSGGFLPLGLAKLKKEVKSLVTARRQGVMFGLSTPKRFSMNLMTEV